MIRARNIVDKCIPPYKLMDNHRKGKYMYADIGADQPMVYRIASSIPALPTASQGQTNYVLGTAGHNPYFLEMYQSTAQTLMPTRDATKGLEIGLDQVNNETVEYVIGGNHPKNPLSFLVGTDTDFYVSATFLLDTAGGPDQFGIGFRKQEAFQVPTSFLSGGNAVYTDYALFGFAGTVAAANPVRLSTDVGASGTATVSSSGFTWADGKAHKLTIRVIGRAVTCYINDVQVGGGTQITVDAAGAAITAQNTTPLTAYSFTAALRLIPFIFCRQDATVSPIYLQHIGVGHLVDLGLDKNNEVNS